MGVDTEKLAGTTSENAAGAIMQKDLTQRDLALLVCPVCRSALVLQQAVGPAQPKVLCAGCGRQYPVTDGIPILLGERASITDQMPSFKREDSTESHNT
jgi:uncharacterized protein YbaR (Trm112 family)